MSYTIVTSIFDIKRYHSGINRWRSTERYIKMLDYIISLNVEVILFIDEHLKDRINTNNNLTIIQMKLEELPSYIKIKNIEGLTPVGNGQHVNKMFVSVITDKFYLISEAKKYSKSDYFIWMDSGIAHLGTIDNTLFDEYIKLNIYRDKITIYLMKAIHQNEIKNLAEHLKYSRGKVSAAISIFPREMIDWYVKEINELFDYSIKELKLMCFEEQLMGVILAKFPDKFEYIFGDYEGMLQNLKYITTDMQTVIYNLDHCRNHSLYDVGYKIIMKILHSISEVKCHINKSNFNDYCYNAQIICYYKDRELCIYFSNILGFLYYNTPEGNKYIKEKYNNIKQNMSYVEINLDDNQLFTERKIIEMDVHNILWPIF